MTQNSQARATGFKFGRGRYLAVQLWTIFRVPLAVGFGCLALWSAGWSGALILGLVLLSLIEITDLTDGLLARKLGVVSPFGAMLDPYADSVARLIVFWSLGEAGLLFPAVVLVMAVRDVTVAYCRIVLAGSGQPVSARLGGKIKAGVQGFAAITAWLGPWYWPMVGAWTVTALSWLVIVVTAYSAIDYLRGALPLLLDRE